MFSFGFEGSFNKTVKLYLIHFGVVQSAVQVVLEFLNKSVSPVYPNAMCRVAFQTGLNAT